MQCITCKQDLDLDCFYKGRKNPIWKCLSCSRKYAKEYKIRKGRKYTAEYHWKQNNIAMTLEEFDMRKKEQNNKCAICNNEETARDHRTKSIKELAVDHSHATGQVRGLLCRQCNSLLGMAHDNIDILKASIYYLSIRNQS